jgi:cation:H+ antiporter
VGRLHSLVLILLVAATAVVKGADWFVESAVWIARRTGMSEMVIGATLVSVATTLPETAVSTFASWRGHPELALGNALGSCVVNGGLILGLASLLSGFTRVGGEFARRCATLFAAAALLGLVASGGEITRVGGLALLGFIGAGGWMVWRRAVRQAQAASGLGVISPDDRGKGGPVPDEDRPAAHVLRFVFGAALIALGSRYMVSAGSALAVALGMSESAVGLTLVSAGTSLPELATAIAAALRGHSELSLGNLLGASTLNLTMVLGLAALANPLPVDQATLSVHLPLVATLTLLLLLFGVLRRGLGKPEGLTLLVLYAWYLALIFGS